MRCGGAAVPKSTTAKKPRPDFPLFPHATGRWAKKVRGKFAYFGKVADDPDGSAALNLWLDQRDDLLAGRTPRGPGEYLSVSSLCNQFLTAKRRHVDTGELSVRSWGDYYTTCETIVAGFGRGRAVDDLRPDDFANLRASLAKRNGPIRLGNEIQRVRTLLKWAFDSELIDRPVRTGPDFRKPAKHVIRKARRENGPRMFEPHELRTMLKSAQPQLRAMIYLGLNCGLGNHDCGSLRLGNIDLQASWLNYPRPKTGIPRRCPLWPETVAALKKAIDSRPEPLHKANADRVFLTVKRVPFTADAKIKENGGAGPRIDSVTQAFRRLLGELKMHRHGLGFYTLRHVFETVAGGTTDQVAVDLIMGHTDLSMAAHYRERIDDSRLMAVVEHVRAWLWPPLQRHAK
jgi:integrase